MAITLTKPVVGGSQDSWGTTLNTALDDIADALNGVDAITPNFTSWQIGGTAVTATAAELNILDGATVTTAELNKLDGVTATTAELNYVDGVTSNIQTQLDAKQAADATLTALAGLATGSNKIPYSTGTDTFGQLDFKDEDNMASNSATAVPSQQSVKAYADAGSITKTSGSAPYYGVRAWGSVAANALEAGGNFASWNASTNTVTFTTAMPHADYAVAVNSASYGNAFASSMTVNGFIVNVVSSGGNVFDPSDFQFIVIC